jgi:hypothetical protein
MKRRYDRRHRRIRVKYAALVKAGNAVCARCGKPIAPNELGILTTTTRTHCSVATWALLTAAATGRS